MRVLFDIIHPAHALFFHRPIVRLKELGHEVVVASRTKKDITTDVLDRLGHEHVPVTAARSGAMGLLLELALRDAAILRLAMKFRPDAMAGFGGIAISHVGLLTRTPSLSFYDTEIATLQMSITLPFISEWHVPDSYTGPVPKKRTFRFAGPRQLSYFHPDNFKPDRARAVAAGLDPERDNFVVRTVAWSSNHDFGKGGIPAAELARLVEQLSATGRVHISAEGRLPEGLERHRYRGDVLDLHHVMAFSRAYVGESATMAAEAAVLGVPAVYAIDDYRGFVDQLADRGLILRSDGTVDHMLDLVRSAAGKPREHWLDLRDRAVADWVNVSDYVVDALLRHAPRR